MNKKSSFKIDRVFKSLVENYKATRRMEMKLSDDIQKVLDKYGVDNSCNFTKFSEIALSSLQVYFSSKWKKSISDNTGLDDENWLEYFVYECDCGNIPHKIEVTSKSAENINNISQKYEIKDIESFQKFCDDNLRR